MSLCGSYQFPLTVEHILSHLSFVDASVLSFEDCEGTVSISKDTLEMISIDVIDFTFSMLLTFIVDLSVVLGTIIVFNG